MKKLVKNAPHSKRLLFWSVVVIFVIGAIHLALQYININVLNEEFGSFYELTNRFDLDDEQSIPTWISQFTFLAISLSSLLLVYLEKLRAKKVIWSVLAIVALVGSLDEVATLHENVLQSLHLLFFDESAPTIFANAWVIIVPFVLLAGVLFVYKAFALLPKKTLQLLVVAFVVYMTGDVLIDILTSSDTSHVGLASQGILVAAEELLELTGLAITMYALVEYTERKFSKKIIRAKRELLK